MLNGQKQMTLHGIVKRLYQKNGEQMYKFKEDETIKEHRSLYQQYLFSTLF